MPGSNEPFMTPGQMPNSGIQDMYNQSPSGAMSNMSMSQRQQFSYGSGYDRRWVNLQEKAKPISKNDPLSPYFPITPCREHSSLHFVQHLRISLGVKPLVMTESSCSQEVIRKNCHTLEVTQAAADQHVGVFDSCLELVAVLGCDGINWHLS